MRLPSILRTRLVGFVYLGYFVAAIGGVIVSRLGQPTLGWCIGLLSTLIYAGLIVLVTDRLRVGSRAIARVGVALGIVGCVVQAVAQVMAGSGDASQQMLVAALPFFGGFCVCLGWLIIRSQSVPRAIGVLLIAAGVAWLSFAYPPLGAAIALIAIPLGFLAEASLMLWLVVFGLPENGMNGADTRI